KGNHQDVRDYIDRVRAEMPEGYLKQRAVLDLMYMESFARQPERDFTKAIALGEEFLKSYSTDSNPELLREHASACVMVGTWYRYKGNIGKATEYFERTLKEYPRDAVYFYRRHPHGEALIGLADFARASGDIERQLELIEEILLEFPNDETAGMAKAHFEQIT